MSAARQEVRYQRLQEAETDGKEEEDEVTVHLYSHSSRPVARAHCRDASLRICSSLLLLAVAIGFVLYELDYEGLAAHSAQPSFYGGMGTPWNISILENSSTITKNHDTHHHHHDEDEDHQHGAGEHSHSAGTYHLAAVVTGSESCSRVAQDVLKSDGSVVDAGVASVLCLAVLHSHTVSLGGVFTSIYFNGTTQNASVLNTIPRDASPIPYGIPTVLQGLWTLHQEHGRKPWSQLFNPAVQLASEGFLMDSSLHSALEKNQRKTMSSEGLLHLFYDHNGLKSVGTSVANVQLGNLLEIARTMVDGALPDMLIQKLLSDISIDDRETFHDTLSMVHPKSSDPVQFHLDGLTLFSSSLPTSGGILTSSVREVYWRYKNMSSATISEILINASKTMYSEAGAWPPDPNDDHVVGPRRQQDVAPVGSNVLVADSNGDMLVISLTLNSTFGSGFVSPSTGILLSDFVQGAAAASPTLSFWACPSVLVGSDNDVMGLTGQGGSSVPVSLAQVLLSQILLQTELPDSINRTMPDFTLADSDPWLRYFGLQGPAPETRMAIEVRAEHVHVVTAPSCSCHHAGL